MAADLEAPDPLDHVPPGWLALRLAWVAVQLVAVIYFGQQGVLFFYQNF